MSVADIKDLEKGKFDELGNVKVSSGLIFELNDFESIGLITYIGKSNTETYLIEQIIENATGLSKAYAEISINPLITNYADAWINRATLAYAPR